MSADTRPGGLTRFRPLLRGARRQDTPPRAAYIRIGADWRVVQVDAAARRLLQPTVEIEIGEPIWTQFPVAGNAEVAATLRRVVATGVSETLDVDYREPLNAWRELTIVADTRGGAGIHVGDVTSRHEAQELLQLAVDFGEILISAVSVDALVTALALMAVPRLADWSIVSLVGADGELHDASWWHGNPTMADTLTNYSAARMDDHGHRRAHRMVDDDEPIVVPAGAMAAELTSLATPAARHLLLELAPESSVTVPFRTGNTVAGALTLCRSAARLPPNRQEIAVAAGMCRRTALAVDNARLYAALAAAAAQQRAVADAVQQVMLTRLPEPDGISLAVRYRTADEGVQVGGDWYDAMISRDGSTTVTIGDVVGHDIGAAALMGQLRTTLRAFAWESEGTPAQTVERLDRASCGTRLGAVASLITGRIEPVPGSHGDGYRLHWTNAGHPPPVLLRPDGTAEVLTAEPDLLLGVMPASKRHDHLCALPPASTLLFYTDGLVETRNDSIDAGIGRLVDVLRAHHRLPLDELLDTILLEMTGDRHADDIALLAARLTRRCHPRVLRPWPT